MPPPPSDTPAATAASNRTAADQGAKPHSSNATASPPHLWKQQYQPTIMFGSAPQYAYSPQFDHKQVSAAQVAAVACGGPPGTTAPIMLPFPVHPAAMYGQMQQMQLDLQAVQQQVQAGMGPLTSAQQAELARARQRGQRAAAAKQKLNKQKAALAAKRAKIEAEEAAKKKAAAEKRKRENPREDADSDEARASALEAIEATDVSALAAMTPEQQNEEIDKRLSGVECVKEQKRLKRLLRNRVSAQQARERKKSYVSQLEDKSKEQENEIAMLNQKVQALQQENAMLRQVVKNIRMKDSYE